MKVIESTSAEHQLSGHRLGIRVEYCVLGSGRSPMPSFKNRREAEEWVQRHSRQAEGTGA